MPRNRRQLRLVDEGRRRRVAEEAAAELRQQRQQLTAQLADHEAAHRDEAAAARRRTADTEEAASVAVAAALADNEAQVSMGLAACRVGPAALVCRSGGAHALQQRIRPRNCGAKSCCFRLCFSA